MTFQMVLGIILAVILLNNYAPLHFLETGAVLENKRSVKRSLALGLGITVVTLLSTLITWPLNKLVLSSSISKQ